MAAAPAAPEPLERNDKGEQRPEAVSERNPTNNLYVGNLFFDAKEEELIQAFQQYGEVVSVKICKDEQGMARGFAFIGFATTKQAKAAHDGMNRKTFLGRPLVMGFAERRRQALSATDKTYPEHPPNPTLYVCNISYSAKDEELQELFGPPLRDLVDVRVGVDRNTGKLRGGAHAEFKTTEAATEAKEALSGRQFLDRTLSVYFAKPSENRPRSKLQAAERNAEATGSASGSPAVSDVAKSADAPTMSPAQV